MSSDANDKTFIVMPAYCPGDELPGLIEMLLGYDMDRFRIIMIDDGSGLHFRPIFDELSRNLRITVLTHDENQGKGAALKTGFRYLMSRKITGTVVTADIDGQHNPYDISRVAQASSSHPDSLILGCRSMSGMKIPLRSRFGNFWSAKIFKIMTSIDISDVQTGLRGIPLSYLPILISLPQEKFDFEIAMLIDNAVHKRYPVIEVSIESVYAPNQVSHFQPFRDSMQILKAMKNASE